MLLEPKFINKYPDFPAHITQLGKFVYYRTYSRYLPHYKRRETWKETCKRATEYNVKLAETHLKELGYKIDSKLRTALQKEAEGLFDDMFNLRRFLSGRTLWVGGAENGVADKYPLANFNCSFINITKYEDLADLFYLLLVGTGVGFKATKSNVAKLPLVRRDITIINKPYEPLPKAERIEHTQVHDMGNGYVKIWVGDSKEGWVEALRYYFEVLTDSKYNHVHTIKFSYNSVRPKGERLVTFGGTASGPEPLMEMFMGIDSVIKGTIDAYTAPPKRVKVVDGREYVQLRPVHVLDIGNLVGANVVVGGVRRTAEIFLFDADDFESMFAKFGINGIWDTIDPVTGKVTKTAEAKLNEVVKQLRVIGQTALADKLAKFPLRNDQARPLHHRRMSNNSVAFETKPSKELLHLLIILQISEGEPGFFNLEEARRRRPNAEGINPCAEILLASYGVCNLTTVNLVQFVVKEGDRYVLDIDGLVKAQEGSARAGLRMTLAKLELPHWNKIQQRDRLLGTSLTGVEDAMGMLGWGKEAKNHLLNILHATARNEADRYAKELRVNAPLLVTTVKPEGTISQVAGGVSSGLHYSHAPYYIRRIRINASDPLAKAVQAMGWTVHAEVGTAGFTSVSDLSKPEVIAQARTLVIDFPVKSGAVRTKGDVTAIEQLNNYFDYQKHYTEHNSSNTIHVRPEEWADVERTIFKRWKEFTAVSFLAFDGGSYTLAPYETITEAQYNKMSANFAEFDPSILAQFETGDDFELDQDGCESGICPVR